MSERAVYDTMIFFQWAALPANRQHQTIQALYDGSIRLCLNAELVAEIKDVLSRPEITKKAPSLTPQRIRDVLNEGLAHADWFENVPHRFSIPTHSDDDHLFNLAISASARYLVTWETRWLNLFAGETQQATQLRALAPHLEIVTPVLLAEKLRAKRPQR